MPPTIDTPLGSITGSKQLSRVTALNGGGGWGGQEEGGGGVAGDDCGGEGGDAGEKAAAHGRAAVPQGRNDTAPLPVCVSFATETVPRQVSEHTEVEARPHEDGSTSMGPEHNFPEGAPRWHKDNQIRILK